MNKYHFALVGILLCGMLCAFAPKKDPAKSEKIFMSHADEALSAIEQGAIKLNIKGVAIVVFVPGDSVRSWTSKMKVVGQLKKGSSNLLGVANTKASEMADTYQDSGSGVRPPLRGEYGYKGGVIRKVSSGYIMAVFSGGSPDQDKEAATAGVELLAKYFN
ncbi:hypothetical protein ACFGVR_08440 [Mucilaginibacter sp. AW1-3]